MDNETIRIVLVLVSFPIVVATMSAIMLRVIRYSSTFACPHCSHPIPKTVRRLALPCPECGEVVEPESERTADPSPADECRKCGEPQGSPKPLVRLWDGGGYCSKCIERHAPLLVGTSPPPVLMEDLSLPASKVAFGTFKMSFFTMAGFAALIGLLIGIGDWREGLKGFAVLFVVGLPIIALWTGGGAMAMRLMRPKAIAWNGRFMARSGSTLVVAPFSDCTWREGCFSEMTAWKYAYLFRRPAIVISMPNESGGSEKVAVGLSPQFYELWKSFLTLADVPLTPPKRRRRFWPFGSRTTAD